MGQQNKEKLCSNSLQPIFKPKSWFWIGAGQLGIPSTPLMQKSFSKQDKSWKVGRRNPHFVLKIDLCVAVREMLYSGTIKYRREPLTCNRYIDYTVHKKKKPPVSGVIVWKKIHRVVLLLPPFDIFINE